jgi:putative spermidine/putrescine transport system ATP-binding protein
VSLADLAVVENRNPPQAWAQFVSTDRSLGRQLIVSGVRHQYGSVVALADVDLTVQAGQFLVLLGPSGCGKTTLLRAIAGFISPAAGRLFIDRTDISNLPPEERRVGIVFQNYALFPHMTVFENVAYGLEARRVPRKEVARRVADVLQVVQLHNLDHRFPRQLSGGQQQRAALARALAIQPNLLLLDEPFGALDKNLRLEMQIEVRRIQRQMGTTTLMVTHDQEEALSISDRIAVMNHGRIVQYGTPDEIYDCPADRFVGDFVGSINLMPAELLATEGKVAHFRIAGSFEIRAISRGPVTRCGLVLVGIRPENLLLKRPGEGNTDGTIRQIVPLGPLNQIHVSLSGLSVMVSVPGRLDRSVFAVGAPVSVSIDENAPCSVFEP